MVRLSLPVLSSLLLLSTSCHAFVTPHQRVAPSSTTTRLYADSSSSDKMKRPLVLLTFDLDDTLYPIAPVIKEANDAFAKAMERYGYDNIAPNVIDETAKQVREEMEPADAAALSHTEARELAIRRQMENVLLQRKLSETAEDWVTRVEDLSPVVVENAKRWTARAVSDSIVQAVLTAWEMERHHAAERNLYPEVQQVLKEVQETHHGVIIGAVTDGKANPMLMTFTLAPYFDFCMSWEDDQKGRSQFFRDLASSSTSAQLSWIYNAAIEKGQELATTQSAIRAAKYPEDEFFDFENGIWIHVGDDLAYDVGGAAACGAKTILCELADEYQQTARQRFDHVEINDNADSTTITSSNGKKKELPAWTTSPQFELQARKAMNEAARPKVDETIHFINELPDAINRIVAKAQEEEGSLLPSKVNASQK